MKNKLPEMNAGSMADIAFLLLIFFLVTTTMNVDSGILRKLPSINIDKPKPIPERNVLQVYINSSDELMIQSERIGIEELKKAVKDFLTPRPDMHDNTQFAQTKEIELDQLGIIQKSKGVISLVNDRGTTYHMYIQTQNEIAKAIKELRNKFALDHFGLDYDEIAEIDEEKRKIIQKAIPMSISEAEPVDFGDMK